MSCSDAFIFLKEYANDYGSLIAFTDKEPKDFMVPSRWGTVSPQLLHSIFDSNRNPTDR